MEDSKSWISGRTDVKSYLLNMTAQPYLLVYDCIYNAIALVACVTLALKRTSQHLIMEREGAYELPSLAKELLIFDGFWRKNNQFSLRLCSLIG